MSCIINDGYELGCSTIGGIEKVYLGTYDAATAYALDADSVISGVTSGATVYMFEQDVEYAGLNQTGAFAPENNTVYYESVLSLKFTNLDADLRNTVLALGRAPLVAVIKSNTGNYFLLGSNLAGRATASTLSLGVAMGDLNGATMEITFKSQDGAFLIDEDLVPTGATGVIGA